MTTDVERFRAGGSGVLYAVMMMPYANSASVDNPNRHTRSENRALRAYNGARQLSRRASIGSSQARSDQPKIVTQQPFARHEVVKLAPSHQLTLGLSGLIYVAYVI